MKSSPDVPRTVEDARRMAERIADADPERRRSLLEGLFSASGGVRRPVSRESDDEGLWARFLLELFHGARVAPSGRAAGDGEGAGAGPEREGGPSAGRLRAILVRLGYTGSGPSQVLGDFASLGEVQEAWGRWTAVRDREELRLRLEAAGHASRLSPALVDFLLFFFRASDPSMYQAACIAVGRHMHHEPALRSYVEEYAARLGIDPWRILELPGRRSHRRLLIVTSASREARSRRPIPEGGLARVPHERVRDMAVYLLALELLLPHHPGLGPHALNVLRALAKAEGTGPDRALAARWTRLLAVLTTVGEAASSEGVGELLLDSLRRRLERFQRLPSGHFARRIRLLGEVDELLRGSLELSPEWWREVGLALLSTIPGEAGLFARSRIRFWAERVGGAEAPRPPLRGARAGESERPSEPGDSGPADVPEGTSAGVTRVLHLLARATPDVHPRPTPHSDPRHAPHSHAGPTQDPLARPTQDPLGRPTQDPLGPPTQDPLGRPTPVPPTRSTQDRPARPPPPPPEAAGEGPVGYGARGVLGGDRHLVAVRALFRYVTAPLGALDSWLSFGEEERAIMAHLAVDLCQYPPLPAVDVERLLDATGIPRPGWIERLGKEGSWEAAAVPAWGTDPGVGARRRSNAARVLLRLGRWEEESHDSLLDPRLVHQMEHDRYLFALLPTDTASDLLPALADSFEHRLRLNLHVDPSFDPEPFLLRAAVRRPHPSFFQLLGGLVADRTYRRPDGEEIALAALIEDLDREATALERPPGDRPTGPGSEGRRAAALARELARLDAERDLVRRLEGLVALLGAGSPDVGSTESIPDLLSWLTPAGSPPVRSGSSAFADAPVEEVIAGMRELAIDVGAAARPLVPASLQQAARVRDARSLLESRLRSVVEAAAPLLPPGDARALAGLVEGTRRLVAEWVVEVNALEREWSAGRRERLAGGRPAWTRLVARVSEVDDPGLRQAALGLTWDSLVREVRGGEDREESKEGDAGNRPPSGEALEDSWAREVRFLRWGGQEGLEMLRSPADRRLWRRELMSHWTDLADQAMEAGYETRVARLVAGRQFGLFARNPDARPFLERARRWFFDCYRLADAVRVTRGINQLRGEGFVTSIPRDVGAFAIHYSPVWIALLVGAILMLDFGDAWTAMAEVGDRRGIGITALLGVLGAFAYIGADLRARVRDAPEDRAWKNAIGRLARVAVFLLCCMLYTLALTSALWFLLAETQEVVRGPGAVLHVTVWAGFALFVGVFFGLLAKAN